MVRPQNPDRKFTTIGSVPKGLILRIRKYAEKSKERKGTESTSVILERIISDYESTHPIESEPHSTY